MNDDIVIDLTQPIPDWPTEDDVRRWLTESRGTLRDRMCKAWLADEVTTLRRLVSHSWSDLHSGEVTDAEAAVYRRAMIGEGDPRKATT